jgi:hypothetical protein
MAPVDRDPVQGLEGDGTMVATTKEIRDLIRVTHSITIQIIILAVLAAFPILHLVEEGLAQVLVEEEVDNAIYFYTFWGFNLLLGICSKYLRCCFGVYQSK